MMLRRHKTALKVVDESGSPIQGARVVVQGMSIQGRSLVTNTQGGVLVNVHHIIGAKWLVVSKDGYENLVIGLVEPLPEIIVLKRAVSQTGR